jgi:hypothetical protein
VIQHPIDDEKYLVHGCLEGPEAGVYYRGQTVIPTTGHAVVRLPDYVTKFARDLQVHATPIFNKEFINTVNVSEVSRDGVFEIIGGGGKVNWVVYGKRADVVVEPLKSKVCVKGDGPYKYI